MYNISHNKRIGCTAKVYVCLKHNCLTNWSKYIHKVLYICEDADAVSHCKPEIFEQNRSFIF
jgi:hypothetical protein